jgi:hypothetical protein
VISCCVYMVGWRGGGGYADDVHLIAHTLTHLRVLCADTYWSRTCTHHIWAEGSRCSQAPLPLFPARVAGASFAVILQADHCELNSSY